jgi:hypothetical protein
MPATVQASPPPLPPVSPEPRPLPREHSPALKAGGIAFTVFGVAQMISGIVLLAMSSEENFGFLFLGAPLLANGAGFVAAGIPMIVDGGKMIPAPTIAPLVVSRPPIAAASSPPAWVPAGLSIGGRF